MAIFDPDIFDNRTFDTPRKISGGGRVYGYFPEPEKKREVIIQWTDEHESELINRLKEIDDEYERKRRKQFDELLVLLRSAIDLGNKISFSGFEYLTPVDVKKAKDTIQQEDEEIILLLVA